MLFVASPHFHRHWPETVDTSGVESSLGDLVHKDGNHWEADVNIEEL